MGGRWRRTLSVIHNLRIAPPLLSKLHFHSPLLSKPHFPSPFFTNRFLTVAAAIPCHLDPDPLHLDGAPENDPSVKIPIKAFFLSTRFFPLLLFQFHSFLFSLLFSCSFRKCVFLRILFLFAYCSISLLVF